MFAIVDGNSFYASCESVFRPDLRGCPICVVSNRDGNIVARSKEAKALGIPDLEPYFKVEHLLKKHNVHVFSSNYALYGDLSNKMVSTLREYAADVEVYSIDEVFLTPVEHLFGNDLVSYGRLLKDVVWREVRIPVGVGIASTKTLSKLANRAAKKIPKLSGVCVVQTEAQREWLLKHAAVKDIWGIGSRISARLNALGIYSGWEFSKQNPKYIRRHFGVTLERTLNELNGVSCLELEDAPPPKKQIFCTRSFGEKTAVLEDILQSTSHYAARAAEKLRLQNSKSGAIYVFLQTSPFGSDLVFFSVTVQFPYPTDDSRLIVNGAISAIKAIFKPGHLYSKSGVGLVDITSNAHRQVDMFTPGQTARDDTLMGVIDKVNQKWGRGTLFLAAEGVHRSLAMKQNRLSPRYTTSWSDIPIVKC